jgi:hypothetical protein
MTMNESQARAYAARIATAIVETVAEVEPRGAPGGILYAALSSQGMTLSQFQSIMNALVAAKRLRREGQVYRLPV